MSNIPEDLSFQILEHIQNKADIEMDLYQKSLNMNSEESVHAMLIMKQKNSNAKFKILCNPNAK